MAILNLGNVFTQSTLTNCAPVTCTVCGGLECLCRPRFFAGQLLTDQDLQRLDHYITAKNKLHNRYLIGWGVACGLEVVCDSCDGMVIVRSGYALSPCGEDIIVCSDAPVDVCSLIQKCKKKQPRDCQPAQTGAADGCSEATEDWVLSICYDEQASRGVIPLKNTGAAACCSRCACGCRGQSSGGCNCGGNTSGGNGNGSKSNGCSCAKQSASAQAQCQPTITCEGYRFEVCKLTGKEPKTRQLGAIVQRFWCCLLKLGELIAQFPANSKPEDVKNWCCAIRDNLLDFTAANPGYDCGLAQLIANMCKADNPQQIGNDVGRFLADYLQYCFCSALLPPCPAPATDDCVPLATITVSMKNGKCTIQRVCNIDARKFLVDMPNLGYWLSWIPFGAELRTIFSNLCCKAFPWQRTSFKPSERAVGFDAGRAAARADTVAAPRPAADFTSLIFEGANRQERKVDLQALTMAALGMQDEKNVHNLTDLELQYPFESLIINQAGGPLLQSFLGGSSLGTIAGIVAGGGAVPAGQPAQPAAKADVQPAQPPAKAEPQPVTNAQIADLKAQLDAVRQDLKRSQDQIDKLTKSKKKQ